MSWIFISLPQKAHMLIQTFYDDPGTVSFYILKKFNETSFDHLYFSFLDQIKPKQSIYGYDMITIPINNQREHEHAHVIFSADHVFSFSLFPFPYLIRVDWMPTVMVVETEPYKNFIYKKIPLLLRPQSYILAFPFPYEVFFSAL